jgi:Caspase domain
MRDTKPQDGARRRLLAGLGLSGLAGVPAVSAWAQGGTPRVALVLGNAAYAAAPLRNAVRDARAMAALLAGLGFEVIEERDASRARMEQAIAQAAHALRGRPGIGLLYYAGHGVQIDWRNYMLPVDVNIESLADVPRQGVDVQRVLQSFKDAGTRMNILMLDACRDNPFGGGTGARGLAPMDAPPGTFFAYATAPGHVADDGTEGEGHGLYTRFLLQELRKPEARIEDVFKRVRLQVRQATKGRQVPWESTSLEEDFVFSSGQPVAAPALDERQRAFEAERVDWERLRESRAPEDFYAFLQRHPSGAFAEQAQFALDRLVRPAVQPQAPPGLSVRPLPSGEDRYRVGDTWEVRLTDHKTGGTPEQRRYRVTSIDGDRVVVNGGRIVLDQMGAVWLNRAGRKDPGVLVAPASLQVGKRWRSEFTNTLKDGFARHNFYDHHAVALQAVDVPAGRFMSYRVVHEGVQIGHQGGLRLSGETWVDPATMWFVRRRTRHLDLHRGWVEFDVTEELVSMTRLPR